MSREYLRYAFPELPLFSLNKRGLGKRLPQVRALPGLPAAVTRQPPLARQQPAARQGARGDQTVTNQLDHTESGQSPGYALLSRLSLPTSAWCPTPGLVRPTHRPLTNDKELANNEPISAASPSVDLRLVPHAPDIPGVQPGQKLRGGRR
jgi:hypothetical protein